MNLDPIDLLFFTWDQSRPAGELLAAVEQVVNVTMPASIPQNGEA